MPHQIAFGFGTTSFYCSPLPNVALMLTVPPRMSLAYAMANLFIHNNLACHLYWLMLMPAPKSPTRQAAC